MGLRGIQEKAFPAIREIILVQSPRFGRPVDRDDIGPKLIHHPRTYRALRDEYRGELGSLDAYVHNLVDWYSQKWTDYENGELTYWQQKWIVPTFKGVRRTEREPGQKHWLYEPEESI